MSTLLNEHKCMEMSEISSYFDKNGFDYNGKRFIKTECFGWITENDIRKYPFLRKDVIPTELINNEVVVSCDYWEWKLEKDELTFKDKEWWLKIRQVRLNIRDLKQRVDDLGL